MLSDARDRPSTVSAFGNLGLLQARREMVRGSDAESLGEVARTDVQFDRAGFLAFDVDPAPDAAVSVAVPLAHPGFKRIESGGSIRKEMVIEHLRRPAARNLGGPSIGEIGRAWGRERVCQYVWISGGAGTLKKKNKYSEE